MALPALSIPDFPLPFHVPIEIHPCVIHLAVALPIVIVLMELVNLVIKKRTLGVFSFFLMVLLALILFGAYLTGNADAEHAKAALNGEAKTLFDAHKLQGIYLVYGALVLVLVKLLSVLIRKTPMRVIFLIFLLAFTALTVNTAKKGKQLVFNYGINVKTAGMAPAAATPKAMTPTKEAAAPAATEKKEEAPKAAEAAPAKEEAKSEAAVEAPKEAAKSEAAQAESGHPAEKAEEPMEKKAEATAVKAAEEAAPAPEAPSAPEAPEAAAAPAAAN